MAVDRHFTPKEANRTLPLVKRIVADILETSGRIREMAEGLGEAARDDPGVRKQIDALNDLFEELEEIGCSYKDWSFSVGLVDFPAMINGKEVELCWRSDEPEIVYYHGPEGYVGRKPIPNEYLE